ncbi:MAG: DUF6804 family protein [Phycisphaerae bacterium]|nr:DUF6804 family protein [Phycisphaerae bacterium]
MPRWTLIVLAVGAVLLAALPFDFVPGQYELGVRWLASAALATGAVIAGKQNLALWCGLFAAMAILFQPAFPMDLKQFATGVHVGAAIVTAVCVVREW